MYGTNLRNQLDKKGITAYRLAKDTGISEGTISRILSNKISDPSITVMMKISKALKCKIEDISQIR